MAAQGAASAGKPDKAALHPLAPGGAGDIAPLVRLRGNTPQSRHHADAPAHDKVAPVRGLLFGLALGVVLWGFIILSSIFMLR